MTAICRMDFAKRIATECQEAANRLAVLQGTLGEELIPKDLSPRMIGEIQTLDIVQQTLEDLSRVFRAIGDGSGTVDPSAVADASQETLRRRLNGCRTTDQAGSVDLF